MRVLLKGISKSFGKVKANDNVSLTIEEGDFFTLLGPSGCGKTTLLRTVAGFYSPDEGEIFFGDKKINNVPAHKRETGMVFQNYALFPHLNVFDNIAYGLAAKKIPLKEIKSRVREILKSVQMEGFEKRLPSQLSGGQQQRVALARALVIKPKVLLMDEPLSNLDAKLRVSTREEIKKIQKDLGITTIYVTHDQEEAMAISDYIAIFNEGRIEQIGTPPDIYYRPKRSFVARFMGISNILKANVVAYDDQKLLLQVEVNGESIYLKSNRPYSGTITISLRPEWIKIDHDQTEKRMNRFSGTIVSATFLGSMIRYKVLSFGCRLTIDVHDPQMTGIRAEGETVYFRFDADRPVIIEK